MQKILKKLPQERRELICLAAEIARHLGYRLYLIGGVVRDLILNRVNLDLDITVEGDGINFAILLAERLNARLIRHRKFKTATVITPDKVKIDIATARKEFYPFPASLPVVEQGTLIDDLKRRDFTINAIALRFSLGRPLEIIDLFKGRNDIRERKIRVLHKASFIDDPTRILRAIRFEQRYDFRIERDTLRLLKEAINTGMLEEVSAHRVKYELVLMLREERPVKCLRRIKELAGFSFIADGLGLSQDKIRFLNAIEKTIAWFKQTMPTKRKLDSWLMYFIGLISDLDTQKVAKTCQDFAFRRGESKRILSYKKTITRLEQSLKKRLTPRLLYNLLEPLSYEVILLIIAKSKRKALRQNVKDFLKIYNGIRVSLRGEDLLNLGIPQGPVYKKIIAQVLNAKLERKINTKEEELELVKKLLRR